MHKRGDARLQAQNPAAAALQAKFMQGVGLHQQGKLADAERIYVEVLQTQPNHFDALHLLGVIAFQTRRTERAVELIRKAITLNAKVANAHYNLANALLDLNRLEDALASYEKAIALKPDYAEAYINRANALVDLKRAEEALRCYEKATALKPDYAEAHLNRANALMDLRRAEEALESYDKAIALSPNQAELYSNRGNALMDLKRREEALASYDKAIALKPDYAEAYNNRGTVLRDLKRPEEALANYDAAIALKPAYAEAYSNHGNALLDLKRPEEALASYSKSIALKPDHAEAWLGRGNVLNELNRYEEAIAAFDRTLALRPAFAEAWCNRGNVFKELKCYDEAIVAYDKALALKPDLADACYGRGNVFYDLNHYDKALSAYNKAIELDPDFAGAWLGCGNVFGALNRYEEAFAPFDKALALKPDLAGAEGSRLYTKMHFCDWSNFDNECAHLISSIKNKDVPAIPFQVLAIPSSADDQLQCAMSWVAETCPPFQDPIWKGEQYRHERIRVAYVSADFREHPTSFLMAGVFESHDKSRFDVTAISYGPDDNSEIRQQLKRSFERFVDVNTYSDDEVAKLIKEQEIDILVDLMGFTKGARTAILTKRPAPIQINYLGYPGTMGTEYIDYIIADRIVIPDNQRNLYREKIAFLPNSYQANDGDRSVAERNFTRSEVGLPPKGFVFCCFNNNFKITPSIFDSWMRILKQVDGSVLWLLENNETAASHLRKEAAARDTNPERLIFAKRMPLSDHLARHRLADLFLDTVPYSAHTTASDALWVGLPVLTCIGETFAGRVAASLLNAIHLPELITTTLEDYERLAVEFATDLERLTRIKRKLADNRLTAPLFDTTLFTRHIEAGYTAMHERHQAGLAADHIIIQN